MILENIFNNWFDYFVKNVVPNIPNIDVKKIDNSPSLEVLWMYSRRIYENCWGIDMCVAYCIFAPILFPSRREEIANIGITMSQALYISRFKNYKLFYSQGSPQSNLPTEIQEYCITCIRIARALMRS